MEADFAAVWSRVTGAPSPEKSEAPDALLRRFLQQETGYALVLSAAAQMSCDPIVQRSLKEMHSETRRQMKRLRAALYLLSGVCDCPQPISFSGSTEPMTVLKQLYTNADAAASAYRNAAAETNRPALETLYASLAEAKAKHAACLLSITERFI